MSYKTKIYTGLIILLFFTKAVIIEAHNLAPPISFLHDLTVHEVEDEMILEWYTYKASIIDYFIIERARINSNEFKSIGKIKANKDLKDVIYLFSDEIPLKDNLYRIRIILTNGDTYISNIVSNN